MEKRKKLICKDCYTEIFVDINMVMLKDSLWLGVCDHWDDALCDNCIEKRLGRKIWVTDFKLTEGYKFHPPRMIPCNVMWVEHQKLKNTKEK
ncbi:MAG: hypothetical protein V4547_18250 [Bacteroidota bacterium]